MIYSDVLSVLNHVSKIWKQHRNGRPSERVLQALDAETNVARLVWQKHIVGYGVGPKIRDGHVVAEHALRLYVRRKIAENRLSPGVRIPKRLHLRKLHRYMPIDVIEQGRPFCAQRAVQPSDPAAHISGPAGIIGLGVLSNDDGSPVILGCAHVFAPRDHMAPGPLAANIIEAPPAPTSNSLANRIGTLKLFTQFSDDNPNTIDAATCTPDTGITFPIAMIAGQSLAGIWDPSADAGPLRGRKVWRLDQQGNRVDGEVIGVDAQDIDFLDGLPRVHFQPIIRYQARNQGGDSGGAVVETLTNLLMGLHFGGDGVDQSLFCLASLVFPALNIKLR